MKDLRNHLTFNPLFAAVALALLAPQAHAQIVNTDLLEAKGYYQLGSDLPWSQTVSNTSSVDVLAFPSNAMGDMAGLHSYGNAYAAFGSRSSGYGIYDVTGSFKIVQTITNNTASAQNVNFSFYITPGMLQNDVRSVFSGAQFVSSGLAFDIKRDGSSIWGSSATLSTTASGTSFTSNGAALYTTSASDPTYYSINGLSQNVDLGVLGAGNSLQLSYTLSTFAKGNATGGPDIVVPEHSFVVPDQWVQGQCDGYGYGGNCGNGSFLPGEVITVPGYTIHGQTSGSHGSSGDPFSFSFDNPDPVTGFTGMPLTANFDPYSQAALPPGISQGVVQFTSAVPEPSGYALMALGLLPVLALARRRKQQPSS
ncbi:hypothetical protein BH11PSE10_BH11PSE10_00540 [soil metagenome]